MDRTPATRNESQHFKLTAIVSLKILSISRGPKKRPITDCTGRRRTEQQGLSVALHCFEPSAHQKRAEAPPMFAATTMQQENTKTERMRRETATLRSGSVPVSDDRVRQFLTALSFSSPAELHTSARAAHCDHEPPSHTFTVNLYWAKLHT